MFFPSRTYPMPLCSYNLSSLHDIQQIRVQRMAAAQLRLLRVLALELVADGIEQLHVALLRVLLERSDEGERHGARGLARDLCVLPVGEKDIVSEWSGGCVRECVERRRSCA